MYKYPTTIFDCIRQERQDFLYNYIDIAGFTFNQYQNIQKIHKYYNSHYNDGDYETINGIIRKKVFWNIGKRRCTIASKQIDIDTKDFLLIPENQATEWNVHLLEKELKVWMKKEKFAKILNQISDELPIYGSVVLRKTKEGAELIDLRKFFCEQAAESLKKSRYKIIKHEMTPEAMRDMEDSWDNVRDAINKFAITSTKSYEDNGQINIENTTPIVEVYERFAEVPVSYFRKDKDGNYMGCLVGDGSQDDEEFTYARFITTGVDNLVTGQITANNPKGQYHAPGIILFAEELKKEDDPFKECHYRKTKGRWQGIGLIEDTFEDQRMINKTKEQEDKASEIASLILWQTAQEMTAKNVMTDVDNGEILKGVELNRLDNENKALPAMQAIAQAYELHADLNTFSADQLGGKENPSSATLGAVQLQAQTSASVYDYMREDYGIFLNEFTIDLVMPDMEKEITFEHDFRYAGDLMEMDKIRERAIRGYIRLQIMEGKMEVPTKEEADVLVKEWKVLYAKQGSHMWIKVQKDFFKNLNYEMSLEITGEGRDIQAWLNNLVMVLKLTGGRPLSALDPLSKKVLFKILSAIGMSIGELENAETEMTQMQDQQMQLQQSQQPQQQPQPAMQPMMMGGQQ